jgi:VanZ family protein
MGPECHRLVRRHRPYSELVLNSDQQPAISLMPTWRGRLYRYTPLLFWIALIFFFSSTAASANQTSRIIGPILHFLFPSISDETFQQYHFFIRKCAHFTEYALLAFWAIWALIRSSHEFLKKYRFLLAVLLVLVVASADEFNQSFEPSRTSSPWDVLLDCIGGATMAASLWLWRSWSGRRLPDRDSRTL